MNLLNNVSFSVLYLYFIPFILFLFTKDNIHIKVLIGLGITTLLSEFLKNGIIKNQSVRPNGAKDCNLWCNDGNQEGKPGMPSTHSAQAAFFTSMYYFQTTNPIIRTLLVAYQLSVIISRYLKRCHTLEQIGAGTLFGLCMSWFFQLCVN